MTRHSTEQGFTAVELLVALVVGVLLLGSAYQLYTTITANAGDSSRRAQASNVAYALLRQYQNSTSYVTNPCTTSTATPTVPSYANLPNATATLTVSCPYTDVTELSLMTITITFNNANTTEQVTRALTTEAS